MLLKKILIFLIRVYKGAISPFAGQHCRFYPSCSSYTIEAIEKFGCYKGIVLSIKRILRCNIFNPGGLDPVPERIKK
jgi:putative membrane protein insertion efficiency factor